ncbi:hypothetical protein DUNSADRAFT_240 [Dunaliella salina]|uniref:DNA-(apurinic or apyrimidinic site) lyase n=1 Tax=Dunaliella salina TaxID=3046 RepID=A0ABQ7FZB5_DUNSA|nr:hypothetical protein DUNSADRAFT_240 [Dunaliella salina]|eukprot:KAF5827694.1 hypothetical protein DUNSADRAFT_240 [Dunaliella salina]
MLPMKHLQSSLSPHAHSLLRGALPFHAASGRFPCAVAIKLSEAKAVKSRNTHRASTPNLKPPNSMWSSLSTDDVELKLKFTLPTGQSFRWTQLSEYDFVGVIGPRLVRLRQDSSANGGNVWYRVLARGEGVDVSDDEAAIREYLNLPRKTQGVAAGVSLRKLAPEWSERCERFKAIHPYFKGARMLRQDPVECLFQFICSSNNHISRIGGMVERLCAAYGTPLVPDNSAAAAAAAAAAAVAPADKEGPLITTESVKDTNVGQWKQQQHQQQQEGGLQAAGVHSQPAAFVTPLKGEPLVTPLKRDPQGDGSGAADSLRGPQPQPPPLGRARGTKRAAGNAANQSAWNSDGSTKDQGGAVSPLSPEPLQGQGIQESGAAAGEHNVDEDDGACLELLAGKSFYAFPTLQQLAGAKEADLRAAGFGYRARFIVDSAAELARKEGGGEAWLLGLRDKSYTEAVEALTSLPGVGPKVAACVCLFSLDKHGAVPVDTHVWQIAQRWQPSLRGKTLTQKMHGDIQDAFIQKYGEYAGWAHNTLFIAELASQQHRLPPHLQAKGTKGGKESARRGKGSSGSAQEEGSADVAEGKGLASDDANYVAPAVAETKAAKSAVAKSRSSYSNKGPRSKKMKPAGETMF